MAENIGTGKVEKLFRFAGSARVLYDMSEKEFMQIPGITEADVKSVLTYKKAWNLEEAWENLKRSGLYLVTREDENYPKRLLYINVFCHLCHTRQPVFIFHSIYPSQNFLSTFR